MKLYHHIIYRILIFLSQSYYAYSGRSMLLFNVKQDKTVTHTNAVTYSTYTLEQCARLCLNVQVPCCLSLNFYSASTDDNCILLPVNHTTVQEADYQDNPGWKYYGRNLGEYKSCKEALLGNCKTDQMYSLKPHDSLPSFKAYCYYNNSEYFTEVSHDWVEEKTISGPESCPTPLGLINYAGNFNSIVEMVDQSDSCKQYVKVRCKDSQTYLASKGRYRSCQGAHDRNDERIAFFADGDENNYCSCSITNSCYETSHQCNCESSSSSLILQDNGFYRDKNLLPLRRMAGGDTGGSSEAQYFTVGKIKCKST